MLDDQVENDQGPPLLPNPQPLTSRQRVCMYLATSLANDMGTGTRAEQYTAALLRVVADAISRGYEGQAAAAIVEVAKAFELREEGG